MPRLTFIDNRYPIQGRISMVSDGDVRGCDRDAETVQGQGRDQRLGSEDRQAPLSRQGGGCGGTQTGDRMHPMWRDGTYLYVTMACLMRKQRAG
jgi:hypothetical protein